MRAMAVYAVMVVVAVCYAAIGQEASAGRSINTAAAGADAAIAAETAVEYQGAPDSVAESAAPPTSTALSSAKDGRNAEAVVIKPKIAKYSYDAIPKDPVASMLFSATFPGAGQIYNKEYLRGIITGAVFWGCFLAIRIETDRWLRLNTDTLYFQEHTPYGAPTNRYRAVYVLRDDEDMIGLPAEEKVFLGASVVLAGVSYVFGIIDSFMGAKRYNDKLFSLSSVPTDNAGLSLSFAVSPAGTVGVQAMYGW